MIVGTFNKIPKKTSSHSYGWARTWSENLDVPIDHTNSYHEKVYLLHGANFTGGLNLFGGFNDALKESIDNLMNAKFITSLEIECPDYGAMLKGRKDVKEAGLEEWCDKLSERLKDISVIYAADLEFDSIAIGDSHTAAYAPENSCVVKKDGTTLNSQINSNFQYVRDRIKPNHENITLSFGNIDIRHHICRLDANVEEMISKYADFVRELEAEGRTVEVAMPWPIEFEGRRLPQSGYYKKQPFWGSREERTEVLQRFVDACKKEGLSLVDYPSQWLKVEPELYAKTYMEKPQSVHLNPEFYRRKNWGEPEMSLESFF